MTEPGEGGIIATLRRLAQAVGGMVLARFELFVVELQEEKLRAVSLLIWLAVGLALGLSGILVAIGTLALFLWERAGYGGLVGLAAGSLAVAAGIFWQVRRRLRVGPAPFSATTAEFRRDIERLRPPE